MSKPTPRKILVAANAFKGTLTAREACEAIRDGICASAPDDVSVDLCPLADGGDSFLEALCFAHGGTAFDVACVDPLGRSITTQVGLMSDGETAVIEAATANGLRLLSDDERNPMNTTTAGVGDLILGALARSTVKTIVLGIGGSATNDGGIGMAARLGARFVPSFALGCGADLLRISAVELNALDPRLSQVRIKVACDVDNPLFGERGASRVFGPQKGANAAQVEALDSGLSRLAELLHQTETARLPGMGAAGGLGFGCAVFCGASLVPGCKLVMESLKFAELVEKADLVITGEGALDTQSKMGKVPVEVAKCAFSYRKPCFALVGTKRAGWQDCVGAGLLDSCHAVEELGIPIEDSLREPKRYLAALAARVFSSFSP